MAHIERVKDPTQQAEGQPSDTSIRRNGSSEQKHHWGSPTGPIGTYISKRTKRMLDAYRADPDLVAEHANQEEDTARGGYARRQLFELVQNSADALAGSGGGRIWIGLTQEYLYCADEGQPIDQDGVRALMHAYLSPKRGSDEIGRFGLGFKSVLGVSDRPEFFSRSGSFRFDPKAARELLQSVAPDAEHFPVLRLPEAIDPVREIEGDPILSGLAEWASNVVRLQMTDGAHENLQRQMEEFPAEFLLFAEHVSNLTLQYGSHGPTSSYSLSKKGDLYLLNDGDKTTKWLVARAVHELSYEAQEDRRSSDDSGSVQITWAAPIENLGGPVNSGHTSQRRHRACSLVFLMLPGRQMRIGRIYLTELTTASSLLPRQLWLQTPYQDFPQKMIPVGIWMLYHEGLKPGTKITASC